MESRTSLLDLPVEILQGIFELVSAPDAIKRHVITLDNETLKRLRLSSSAANGISVPLLFRKLVLHFPLLDEGALHVSFDRRKAPHKIEELKCLENLQFLAENVHELTVKQEPVYDKLSEAPGDYAYGDDGLMVLWTYPRGHLMIVQNFICSLKKVQMIKWDKACSSLASDLDLSPLARKVTSLEVGLFAWKCDLNLSETTFAAFKVFTNLTSLDVFLSNGETSCPFTYLPQLKHLTFASIATIGASVIDFFNAQTVPFKLKSLNINHQFDRAPVFNHIVPRFLSELQSLTIRGSRATGIAHAGAIWAALLSNKVALRHVDVYTQTPELLDYLLSYRDTIETLRIRFAPYGCSNLSTGDSCREEHVNVETFVNILWQKVIPAHKSTLRSLTIFPGSDHTRSGDGPNRDEQHETARQLNAVEPWGIKREEARRSLALCDRLEFLQMGSASSHGIQEAIDIAATLPSLRTLKYNLRGYTGPPKMDAWCGTGILRFLRLVRDMRDCVQDTRWTGEGWRSDVVGRLSIEIVPVAEMKLIRDEVIGLWKLRDKAAIRRAHAQEADNFYPIPLEM
ncbi:hypothetical protein Dda_6667 [Drechslerella dactyloides]|uniref:F-box domain-containing protein n=1 Tax=Drechslerella dactyloides TaxID=74499 RepID=A0AAD6ITZ4_DREDA|nr:hypothetical protein Dda_6667 [Drechslerella dactyloides]